MARRRLLVKCFWCFSVLSHSVEALLVRDRRRMRLPWRNSGRLVEGFVLLVLAPGTLINAAAQHFSGAPLLRFPCLISLVTGHPCPGCGLTRALTLLWMGDWRNGVGLNPLSPLVFCLLIVLFCLQVRRLLVSQRESIFPNENQLPGLPGCVCREARTDGRVQCR